MKYKIFLCSVGFCLFLYGTVDGQSKLNKLKGEVVAYVISQISMPAHGHVPKRDELIVKVKEKTRDKSGFVRIINEFFAEKTSLPDDIFEGHGTWSFMVVRRVDCDGPLETSLSSSGLSETVVDGETFTRTQSSSIHFIKPSEVKKVAPDQQLPCYSIRSFKKN